MKTLQVISCAYRATTEEQDDTVVWITHAMRGAGGEIDVLLRGHAVNYTVAGQSCDGLAFGDWMQTQPARLPQAISGLIDKGARVYFVDEDAADRGLLDERLISGVQRIPRSSLAGLMGNYERVWQW
jgi:hypothetical protein